MAKYIDADFLLSKKETVGICDAQGNTYGAAEVIFVEDVDNAPAADVEEVRHGKWSKKFNVNYSPFGSPEYLYICSECGREENRQEPYCNCGAKMDGGKE